MRRVDLSLSVSLVGLFLVAGPAHAQQTQIDGAAPPPGTGAAGSGGVTITDGDGKQMSKEEFINRLIGAAYKGASLTQEPLGEDQTREYIRKKDSIERAEEEALPAMTTVEKSITYPLDGGVTPEVWVSAGYSSTIAFFDASGAPWEIEGVTVGNPKAYSVPPPKGDLHQHWLDVTPLVKYRPGNLSVKLKGLAKTLAFDLRQGSSTIHNPFNVRVPGFGPAAKASLIENVRAMETPDAMMMTLLQGTPPSNAQRLTVKNADTRTSAYEVDGFVYVRSPMQLLSPGWKGQLGMGDITVYQISLGTSSQAGPIDTDAPPVLLMSNDGARVEVRLERRSDPTTTKIVTRTVKSGS